QIETRDERRGDEGADEPPDRGAGLPHAATISVLIPESPASRSGLFLLGRRRLLAGHFPARAARLGQTDRDCLLPARDFLAGPSALESSPLPFVHRLLDLLGRLLSVSRHRHSSSIVRTTTAR